MPSTLPAQIIPRQGICSEKQFSKSVFLLLLPIQKSIVMQGLWTVLLLILSNIFMTFAWYGQLKLSQMGKITSDTPLITVILISWAIAFMEYSLMVPANRLGSDINGGPFSLVQLKVIQEVISLTVFSLIVMLVFKGQTIAWNHIVAFILLIAAVFFMFIK